VGFSCCKLVAEAGDSSGTQEGERSPLEAANKQRQR
jgi:hypothetical protein